jgi:tRNA threonylcarbamoyladenosine biosynthesis protein TsaB
MAESADLRGRLLVLGIDTCGPMGSVALCEVSQGELRILSEKELAGRSYSATLVASVGELLAQAGIELRLLDAIVVVNGPGSFTGVRVGVSAAKGLAEGRTDDRTAGGGIAVLAVSRLEVLAAKAGVDSAALDAHRGEVFLRVGAGDGRGSELLAGAEELAAVEPAPNRIAICDESAAELVEAAWPAVELVRLDAPTAADALKLCLPRVVAGECADISILDGHYLRRSDAEIFGEKASQTTSETRQA